MQTARIGQTWVRFRANISAHGRPIGMGQTRTNGQLNGLANGVQVRGCFSARALPQALSMRKCPFCTFTAIPIVARPPSVTAVFDLAAIIDKCSAYLRTLLRTQISKFFTVIIDIQSENCGKITTFSIAPRRHRNQTFSKNESYIDGKRIQFCLIFTHYFPMKSQK